MKDRYISLRNSTAAVAFCLCLGAGASASAFADDDMSEVAAIARMTKLVTPERATEIALAEMPGVATDFDLDHKRKGWVYEIEIVDARGTEWEVELEGVTGKVLRVKRDWF
jgi:uncharacterized membrane protein YkoI